MISFDQIKKLKQKNELLLNQGKCKGDNYSAYTMQSILEFVEKTIKEKERWKKEATKKEKIISQIASVAKKRSRCSK
jgi:hypothetical protein